MAGMDLNDVEYDAFLANDRTLEDPEVIRTERNGRVRLGQHIGSVGDTGNARGGPVHLHFEIINQRGARDPYPELSRHCARA